MDLYLLRHGIAEPGGDHLQDAERALTSEGALKMRQSSLGLKRLGLDFDLIASSPLVRARETAEIVHEVLKLGEPLQLWEELAPGASLEALFRKLQEHRDKASVLLVGHQPDLGYLATRLICGNNLVSLNFKKGGLCCIKVPDTPPEFPGELVWMLTPKVLRLLGGK